MKRVILKIFFFVIGLIICTYIYQKNEELGNLIFAVFIFISIQGPMLYQLKRINDKEIKENLKFVKEGNSRYYNLFTWLGEEKNTDRIIYELIGDRIDKTTTIENLIEVKKLLESKIKGELNEYYLIRNIIEETSNENFLLFIKKFFNITIGAIIIALIPIVLEIIDITNFEGIKVFTYISWGIILLFYLLSLLSVIYKTFSKPKKRAKIILIVLNEIIREREEFLKLNK